MSVCNKCQSVGLPIYPVRYAVAPDYVSVSLPTWAEKKELPDLSKQSKYALRTMRQGYLYVLLQYDNTLNLDIAVYKIDEQGGFWQQDTSQEKELLRLGCNIIKKQQSIPLSETNTSCDNRAHLSSNISFITINKPEQCETAWLAFSEHKWSYETLEQYLYFEDKRDVRMQVIKPKQWLLKQNNQDGIAIANVEAIGSTMDMLLLDNEIGSTNRAINSKQLLSSCNYHLSYPYLYTASPKKEEPISTSSLGVAPFKYDKSLFTKRNTLTKWPFIPTEMQNQEQGFVPTNYSTYLYKKMNSINRNNTGCPPMMVALIDSIGIAAELSSWGNNAINSVKKVMTERQRENAAFSGIQLLEETIKNSDYADNDDKFYQYIYRKNKAYLDAQAYINGLYVAHSNGIPEWRVEQKANGKRVLDIMNRSKTQPVRVIPPIVYGQYAYSVPSLENIYPEKFNAYNLKDDAVSELKLIESRSPIEDIGDEKYSHVFEEIFDLQDDSDRVKIKRLQSELTALKADFEVKAARYKEEWHEKNQTLKSGEQRWRKYQNCLNSDYETYKKDYAIFIDETDNYVSGLLDDLITWVNCFNKKSQFCVSLDIDDLERDSENYLAFANDILMTLGMQSESDKVNQLFTQLIEDTHLDGHNIIWSSVLAGRKLDKDAQRKCVNFLMTLNKNSLPSTMTFNQLLDKLQTVIDFYSGASIENNIVTNLTAGINGISESIFTESPSHQGADTTKEILTLLDAERGAIGEDNSPQAQITAAYIKPIKEASAAALIPLLKYLQHVGGNLSSEFAQAWFVASMPGHLSKTALSKLMASYDKFIDQLKRAMLKDIEAMSRKFAIGYQKLTELTKTVLSNKGVGGTLVGGMLVYQLFTMYTILSDRTLKTHAQQTKANLQLAVATTASISLTFRLAAVCGENGRLGESVIDRVKFLGNFVGSVSGIIKITSSLFWEDNKDKSVSEEGLYWLSTGAEIIGTVDLLLQLSKKSLIQVLENRFILINASLSASVISLSKSFVYQRFIILIVIIAINPWINLGLFFIQLVIELNKEDEMQIWLKRCRFGKAQYGLNDDYRYRYLTSEQEMKELRAIFEKFQRQAAEYQAEQDAIRAKADQKIIDSMVGPSDWQTLFNQR